MALSNEVAETLKAHSSKFKSYTYFPFFKVQPKTEAKEPIDLKEGDYVQITFHFVSYSYNDKSSKLIHGLSMEMDKVTKMNKQKPQPVNTALPPKDSPSPCKKFKLSIE